MASPEQERAFSSPAEDGVGRNVADGRPNEDAAFISVSFFVVLLALPIVSVFFMCARYACERAALGREARRARARARAALRTQFAPSPLDATTADGNDVGENEDREARGTFAARGNNTVRAVVNASTIDRLADAVIAGANPGYRRISRRRRRRIFQNENSIASYRREAVRRDLRRAFRTGDFSNYDRNLLHRVLQEQLDGNDNIEGIEGEYDEETTNFRIPAASIMLHDGSEGEDDGVAAINAFFVSEEPGPASRKTLQSLPSCKIGDKNWQLFMGSPRRPPKPHHVRFMPRELTTEPKRDRLRVRTRLLQILRASLVSIESFVPDLSPRRVRVLQGRQRDRVFAPDAHGRRSGRREPLRSAIQREGFVCPRRGRRPRCLAGVVAGEREQHFF